MTLMLVQYCYHITHPLTPRKNDGVGKNIHGFFVLDDLIPRDDLGQSQGIQEAEKMTCPPSHFFASHPPPLIFRRQPLPSPPHLFRRQELVITRAPDVRLTR